MPPRSLLRAFLALWIVAGLVLFIGSVDTIRTALVGARHANPHIVLLGSVEATAALLFLLPQAMRAGAAGLLITIVIAFGVHTSIGQFRGDLLVYGTVVLFVAIHGPLTASQWRAAVSRRPDNVR